MSPPAREPQRWLFSRTTDVLVFGGSAAASFALLALGRAAGLFARPSPPWIWLLLVVSVDVAHVWSTLFRVYLDPVERRRRPALYLGTPVAVYLAGVALHLASRRAFWVALAYTAVFHFVRQQYGWVALYKRRNHDHAPLDNALDAAAIYNATLFPLLYWHAHLPRGFEWFVPGDFLAGVPARLATALHPVHLALMGLWAARQVARYARDGRWNAGKVLVVLTTWACWYVGIVATDNDYAFTVTNVVIHGVPYLALLHRYTVRRHGRAPSPGDAPSEPSLAQWVARRGVVAFLAMVIVLALAEEGLWDQLFWHERGWLFGDAGLRLGPLASALLVPLLAVPQATHYVLDGWIWRTGPSNPTLLRDLGLARA